MPFRVNGIGSAYIGASNRQVFDGQCEHCHRQVQLQNYETRMWFTVFFIPLIPLVRKQILSYCPRCTWHRAVPFGEWQSITQEAVGTSAAKWDENRDDPEAAIGMHSTLAAFHKRDQADRLAELMLQKFETVSRVHFYMGGWYERTGKSAEADNCFERALELDPSSLPARRAVALGRIEKGRLDEARELLEPFEMPSTAFEPGPFFLLAKAWQKQGQHERARDLFEMLLEARPGLASDKEFRKSVRQSEKALGAETSIVPSDRFYRSKAFRWALAAASVFFAVIAWNRYVKTHRRLHVVNGLKVPITVEIDAAQPIVIGAKGRGEISLAEGNHRAAVSRPAGLAQPVEFSVASGWFERFFSKPVYILDPSRSSALVWQSVVYRPAEAQGGGGGAHHLHIAQPFTTYADVDYHFEPFPHTLQLDHGREKTKTGISVADLELLPLLGTALSEGVPGTALLDYCESHLRAGPAEKLLLAVYQSLAAQSGASERCRDFLGARLNERPVLTDWHRFYQEASEILGRHDELVSQYDRYLEADSGNAALLYLRGRIESDENAARDFYNRGRAADEANPYPWNALSYHYRAAGDFSSAREALETALKLGLDESTTRENLIDTRFALGDFAGIARHCEGELMRWPYNTDLQRQLLEALIAGGEDQKAAEAHAAFVKPAITVPGDRALLQLSSRACLLSLEGKFEELLAAASQMHDGRQAAAARFEACLELGQLEQAGAALGSGTVPQGEWQLLLSLAWNRKGDQAQSVAARERAIAAFQKGRREERRIASLLAQAPDIPARTAESLVVEPLTKAIVLTALADVCPEQKLSLLALADTLNYRRRFPHNFLKSAIAESREGR